MSSNRRRGCGCGPQLGVAVVLVVVGLFSYCSNAQINPVTGEKQYVALSVEQEGALGLQATPQMLSEYGGEEQSTERAALVEQMGQAIIAQAFSDGTPYEFDFHLLKDTETVNAFALPGGQVFITRALFDRLETHGQLAGVLGHEIGHVIERHSAQQMAKQGLTQAMAQAAVVGASGDSQSSAAIAQTIAGLVSMKFSRGDETEADTFAVKILPQAGYDPNSMTKVMEILAEIGGGRQPEFMSTHPDPGNRVAAIRDKIKEIYPDGLPAGLIP